MYTNEHLKESLLTAGSLRLSGNQFHITGPATEKDVVWRRDWRQTGRGRSK